MGYGDADVGRWRELFRLLRVHPEEEINGHVDSGEDAHGHSRKHRLYCCSPLTLKNSLYFGAHLLRHALPQTPIGTAAAMLSMTIMP